ncbi:MAG TPA: dienelactone hydrolase family protein [Candidatus Acidoferrales bacterium]|nr:dienelactone hydrolase family protein [Candidatus Acidoferrales bacterium]
MNRQLTVAVDGDAFDAYLFTGPRSPAPGIVMIPEIYGVNGYLRETAQRYADRGYTVLALDIFWRLERNVQLSYEGADNKRAHALHEIFDYDASIADMQAGTDALRALPECTGKVGIVGFCLGGTLAYLAAARCEVDAAVGYYGTTIHDFLEDAPKIRRPLLLHFGELDHTTPPELMARIVPAIEPNPHVTHYVYEGAGHSFANHTRDYRFHESATAAADARTFALFGTELGV